MKNKGNIIIEKVEYGEEKLSDIVVIQFIRWVNEEKSVNISIS